MSIVISVIDKNDSLFIASDKRAIRNGIINDNFEIEDNEFEFYLDENNITKIEYSDEFSSTKW